LTEELRAWVGEQLSPIAKPDEIRLTDNLPKTRSGKIMRRLLRSLARGEEITQDVSTLENPAILEQLRGVPAAGGSPKQPVLGERAAVGAGTAPQAKRIAPTKGTVRAERAAPRKGGVSAKRAVAGKRVVRSKKPAKAAERKAPTKRAGPAKRRKPAKRAAAATGAAKRKRAAAARSGKKTAKKRSAMPRGRQRTATTARRKPRNKK
jgi:hypothetical protein